MNKKYYYALHIQIDVKYGYSIAIRSDRYLNVLNDEQEIIKLAIVGNFFEEDDDYSLVDDVYEITEKNITNFIDKYEKSIIRSIT